MSAERLIAAHELARDFYRRQLLHAPGPRRYLASRGFGTLVQPGTDEPWYLGYAPPGRYELVDYLRDAGFTRGELLRAGLATVSHAGALVDLFRERVMFPVHDPAGRPVGFLGRALPGAEPHVPKYLNSQATAIYHKGQTLYGLGEQRSRIEAGAAPVVVEGPTDVLAVHLAYPNGERVGLATCGTALTPHQSATIAALPGAASGITVAYDDDPAGHTATLRAFDLLPAHLPLRAATLPSSVDPGSLSGTAEDITRLRAALGDRARPLAEAAIDMEINRLLARQPEAFAFPEGRVAAVRRLAARIAHLPAAQVVVLAARIASRTGASLEAVTLVVIEALERGAGGREV
jgi:DNA primase